MSGPGNYNQAIIEQYRANGGKTNHPLPLVVAHHHGREERRDADESPRLFARWRPLYRPRLQRRRAHQPHLVLQRPAPIPS